MNSLFLIGALWLVFNNGDTSPNVQCDQPVQPTQPQILENQTAYVWTFDPTTGDSNPQHYQLQSGAVVYIGPPTPPSPNPAAPNPQAFIAAVASDSNLTAQVRLALAPLMPIVLSGNQPLIFQSWNDAIAVYGSSGSGILTAQMQSDITGYAATYNIQLVP